MIIVHELGRVKFKKNVSGFCERVKSLSQKYKARVLLDQYSQDSLLLLLRQNGVQNVDVSPWSIRNRDGAFDTLHTLLEDKRILLPKEQTKVLREEISGLQTRWLSSGRRRIESGAAHNDCLFSLLLAVENLKKYIEPRITVVYSG